LPLATLEALAHTRRRPNDQVYIQVSFDAALVLVDRGSSAVLSVPSVVVSIARNYLVNPKHPAFASVLCSGTTDYTFDDRLLNPIPASL